MKPILLTCLMLMISSTHGVRQESSPTYRFNNPLNLPSDIVFYGDHGHIYEIFSNKPNRKVRNLRVPLSGYDIDTIQFKGAGPHAPVYFNLIENGHNLGQYVVIDRTLRRINDGNDVTADYPLNGFWLSSKQVYIGASDGIYVYNPDTQALTKYGSLTDYIVAIEKVSGEDIFYILTSDQRIYRVTNQGTVKTLVEGIQLAKYFVIDFHESIYFIDINNKPQLLYKGSTTPYVFHEFDFDVADAILAPPSYGFRAEDDDIQIIVYTADGVPYILLGNTSVALTDGCTVPGLTAFDAEFLYIHYYARNSKIYVHDILGESPVSNTAYKMSSNRRVNTSKPKTSVKIYNRDLRADFDNLKKAYNF